MIHFKVKIHIPQYMYFKPNICISSTGNNYIKGTRQHRECLICGKEQISNSITGKNHTHWETIK